MNTRKLFKKYTETKFNCILSEYGRIRCKKTLYSRWFCVVVTLSDTQFTILSEPQPLSLQTNTQRFCGFESRCRQ